MHGTRRRGLVKWCRVNCRLWGDVSLAVTFLAPHDGWLKSGCLIASSELVFSCTVVVSSFLCYCCVWLCAHCLFRQWSPLQWSGVPDTSVVSHSPSYSVCASVQCHLLHLSSFHLLSPYLKLSASLVSDVLKCGARRWSFSQTVNSCSLIV